MARKQKIKSRVKLSVFNSLEEQAAFQTGMATAIAGVADVIGQFGEYAMKNGKLPDICSDERKIGFKKGLQEQPQSSREEAIGRGSSGRQTSQRQKGYPSQQGRTPPRHARNRMSCHPCQWTKPMRPPECRRRRTKQAKG